MKEVIKTAGEHIGYSIDDNCIVFGDNDLSINLANRQMDEPVIIDICKDSNGFLVVGAATGVRYVAQVEIPARTYTEVAAKDETSEEETATVEAVPFDIDNCTIYLYGEGI